MKIGSEVTRLTDNDANDFGPSWSPDGEKIAFVSNRYSTGEGDEVGDANAIYSMNADDGSDITRLTEDNADDREPDWSTNTSTPGDDDNKNKHDSKKKHHDDNAKRTLSSFVRAKSTSKLSYGRGSNPTLSTFSVMELRYCFEMIWQLSDKNLAMRMPYHTSFHCYRKK